MSSEPAGADEAAVFGRLLDDAGVFPPARLPMHQAVAAHLRHRASWYADLVGPLVCPDAMVGELAGRLDLLDLDELDIVLTVPGGAGALPAATASVLAEPRLRLRAVEVPLDGADAGRTVAALAAALPDDVAGYVEVPLGSGRSAALETVRCAGHRAKLRTGGTTAQAFPDAGTLAAAIGECVLLDLPFKCTAGLHHAVAHVDPATGFAHHGFLNVLLAAAAAADGAGARGVERALTSTRPEVVRCVTALGPQGVAAARARFVSFGTCSVEEPVEDLLALGLLPAPAPAPGGVR